MTTKPRTADATFAELEELLLPIGIALVPTEDPVAALLYGLSDGDQVRYIGKAESAGGRRHLDENRWLADASADRSARSRIGLESAARAHTLTRRMWTVIWDGTRALETAQMWQGNTVDRLVGQLREGWIPSTREVETLLIRTQVARGVALYNSTDAGMWESRLDTITDLMGVMAADHHLLADGEEC